MSRSAAREIKDSISCDTLEADVNDAYGGVQARDDSGVRTPVGAKIGAGDRRKHLISLNSIFA